MTLKILASLAFFAMGSAAWAMDCCKDCRCCKEAPASTQSQTPAQPPAPAAPAHQH